MKLSFTTTPNRRAEATLASALAAAVLAAASLTAAAAEPQASGGYTASAAPPTITSFVCPNPADSGNGWFACYATYSSSAPATATWTGRPGYQYDDGTWTDFFGQCAYGETVKITLTARNAYGSTVRNASFKCRW
jgi:hypothetical protein